MSRKVRLLLWCAVASVFVAGVGVVWLHQSPTAVSVDTALERWRATPVTTTTAAPAATAPAGAR